MGVDEQDFQVGAVRKFFIGHITEKQPTLNDEMVIPVSRIKFD
jgi:hypothetical protein